MTKPKLGLVTSLTLLKMAMNGGQMPQCTPLSGKALELFDPAFLPGLGVLNADDEKGLQCPFRGCGQWYHMLSGHVHQAHGREGGRDAICRLLGFSPSTRFSSARVIEQRRASLQRAVETGVIDRKAALRASRGVTQRYRGRYKLTVDARNVEDACAEQIKVKVLSFVTDFRRVPSLAEFSALYDGLTRNQVLLRIKDAYGTWNRCLDACGVSTGRRHQDTIGVNELLESLTSWVAVHGDLPTSADAIRRDKAPMLYYYDTYIRRLAPSSNSWPEAMRAAASMLDIHGGRYGLPERKSA